MSEQTIGKIDTFHIEELCGDIEIPCDYMMDENTTCPGDKAEWVLFLVRCECGQGGTALACDTCAQYRMASDGAVECSGCGEVTAPARLAYSYIEAIKKPFA
jgi:hypothetical protein